MKPYGRNLTRLIASCIVIATLAHRTFAADTDWLARLNQYRTMEGLKAVTQDDNLSPGEVEHARYIVKNYSATFRVHGQYEVSMLIEDRSNQWYSYAGFIAGRASDVLIDTGTHAPTWAIDVWTAAPFTRFALLNPHLESVAYGSFCEGGVCAAAINTQSKALSGDLQFRRQIMSGEPITGESEALGGGWGTRYAKPMMFPPDGSTVDLLSVEDELPDPSKSCPGYALPVGLPITIQVGWYLTPRVTGAALEENGHLVHVCAFDANSYVNPDRVTEKLARRGLKNAGAIVIVPKKPLLPGTKYTVHAIVDDTTYTWSFATSAPSQAKP